MTQNKRRHNAQANPYGGGNSYGTANQYSRRYNQPQQQLNQPEPLQRHGESNYSQPSQYSQAGALSQSNTNAPNIPHTDVPISNLPAQGNTVEAPRAQPLSRDNFLTHIEGVKEQIGQLTSNIQAIASIHQRMLSLPDNRSSAELEATVTNMQTRNTQIMDEIKFLERDAVGDPNDRTKSPQVEALKRRFKSQLEDFQKQEADYSKRYREAIGRQYRIVNPDATDAEVEEVANADLGDEGIFTQALKSNRSGQVASVLGAVRARHNNIQRIEKTMSELATLFTQLNEHVTYQRLQIEQAERQNTKVKDDSENANRELDKAIQSAKRARRRKWCILLTTVTFLCVVALTLGLYFELKPK